MDKRRIIWLASYPKSGNTWFRIFMANLMSNADAPVNINELEVSHIFSSRTLFDSITGIPSASLSFEEIDCIRPMVFTKFAESTDEISFIKVHDAYAYNAKGQPIIPADVTKGVVYIIRNPLDVVVSYAHHSGASIDKMIEVMNNDNYGICGLPGRLDLQLRQRLLSWSSHVLSWVNEASLNRIILRYEDMRKDPFAAFKKAVTFFELAYDDEMIRQAIAFSSFEELQKQEKEKGFKECTVNADLFFRKGKAGSWRDTLTAEQVKKIITTHTEVMREFGYLDDDMNPI